MAAPAAFPRPGGQANRCWQFLVMQGGQFSGGALSNRAAVEAAMAAKFEAFGRWYLANYLRQRGRFSVGSFGAADAHLPAAAGAVAAYFVDWLLSRLPPSLPMSPPAAGSGILDQIGDLLGI